MAQAHILVVDDEPDIRTLVQEILEDEGYQVSTAENASTAAEARRGKAIDLALLDIWMPDIDGISLLREWSTNGDISFPVIMMSGHGSVETAVEATKLGAYDFIEKPISLAKLLLTVERALEAGQLKRENEGLKKRLPGVIDPIGISPEMTELKNQLKRLSQHDTWVLLYGEPGVGKATLARHLHSISHRAEGPFIELSAGSIPRENLAAELFGSESGDQVHYGRLEQANGGTLFIEEVAELDLEMQSRVASTLEKMSLMRIGGRDPVSIDIRVVAATRHDLEKAVSDGKFRRELYYQLNVVPLTVPPLRERPEDIPELLRYYAERFPVEESLPYRPISTAAQNRLRNHSWPGNIRELKNLVQRLLILGTGEVELSEIEQTLGNLQPENGNAGGALVGIDPSLPLREAREQFERAYLEAQLKESDGSVGKLAKLSGMERTHLYRKLRSLGIDPKKSN